MRALQTAIGIAWIVFGVYWLVASFDAKRGRRAGDAESRVRSLVEQAS